MRATYGFRATMTALPGRGDVTEGGATKEAHAANFASPRAQALLAELAPLVIGEAQYQDEVPAGGKLNAGGLS